MNISRCDIWYQFIGAMSILGRMAVVCKSFFYPPVLGYLNDGYSHDDG